MYLIIIKSYFHSDRPDLVGLYKEFSQTLATSENLEVKICNKLELCEEFGVNIDWAQTTEELNGLCKAIIKKENTSGRDVFLIGQHNLYFYEGLT